MPATERLSPRDVRHIEEAMELVEKLDKVGCKVTVTFNKGKPIHIETITFTEGKKVHQFASNAYQLKRDLRSIYDKWMSELGQTIEIATILSGRSTEVALRKIEAAKRGVLVK